MGGAVKFYIKIYIVLYCPKNEIKSNKVLLFKVEYDNTVNKKTLICKLILEGFFSCRKNEL